MAVNNSKIEFLKRISELSSTLTELPTSSVLTSITPLTDPRNIRAKMLRNGLAISSFVIFEDFLKNKVGETLEGIKYSKISFNSLHDELKYAVTFDALDSISNRATNLKRNGGDWLTFIQSETKNIASSAGVRYKLSRFSLGWNKSNLTKDDISKWLKIFRIKGGWQTIQKITRKAEVTLVSPESVFISAATMRHSAAHDPNCDALLSDLIQFTKDSKAIALGFDILLTKSLEQINLPNNTLISGSDKISDTDFDFRFVIETNGTWKEFRDTSKRSLNNSFSLNDAIRKAKIKANQNNEIIIIKNSSNEIINWL